MSRYKNRKKEKKLERVHRAKTKHASGMVEVIQAINNRWMAYRTTQVDRDLEPKHALYHGTRRKESLEQIRKEGLCTFNSWIDAKKRLVQALRDNGKEKELHRNNNLQYLVREMQTPHRRSIYVTTGYNASCAWAERNPEQVFLGLDAAGMNFQDIQKYLNSAFGRPIRITLKHKLAIHNPNLSTMVPCIKPEDIEKVEYCTVPMHDKDGQLKTIAMMSVDGSEGI